MKKYLTIGNVLRCSALVLGIIAFFFMFGDQIKLKNGPSYSFSITFFELDGALGFAGYILIGIATLITCFLFFNSLFYYVKLNRRAELCAYGLTTLLFLLGGIFVFCTAAVIGNLVALTAFSIVAGIFSIIAAICVSLSALVEK